MKYLYSIKSNLSGKEYIGVTIDLERRWKQHTNPKVIKNSAIKDAINKYGKENFTMKVLCFDTDLTIDRLEVKMIKYCNTQVPNGYNLTIGGDGASYVEWEEDWNKLLGTDTDKVISERLGLGQGLITNRRVGLGIQSYRNKTKIDWSEFDKLLGTLTDKDLAKKVGCCASTVENRRNLKGVAPKTKPRTRYTYTQEILDSLGKEPDTVLSEKYGIPSSTLNQKRRSLGIPKAKLEVGWRRILWTEDQKEVLNNTGLDVQQVVTLLDVTNSSVLKYRRDNNIKFTGLDKNGKRNYIPFEGEFLVDMLDTTMTNVQIAEKHGLEKGTVHYKRNCKNFLDIKGRKNNE